MRYSAAARKSSSREEFTGKTDGTAAVTMARDIRPLIPEDLPELSRFLVAGFHTPLDADFAAPAVLRWKYLDREASAGLRPGLEATGLRPNGRRSRGSTRLFTPALRSALSLRSSTGKIVGHLGLCRTSFRGAGITTPCGRVTTMHIIDWLGSSDERSVGISLMRLSHQGVDPSSAWASALAHSPSASEPVINFAAWYRSLTACCDRLLVSQGGSWSPREGVPVGPCARRRHPIDAPARRATVTRAGSSFGPEIEQIVAKAEKHVILTEGRPCPFERIPPFPKAGFLRLAFTR